MIEEFPPAEGEFPPVFAIRRTTPGYFEAMRIPVVEGRAFTSDDHDRRLGSVIISRSVKDRYWPDTSALGKRITVAGVPTRVVGVVGDVRATGLDLPPDQFVYLPMLDAEGNLNPVAAMTLTVRTAVEPLSLVNAIRSAIAELDPDLPMADVRPMQRVLGDSMSRTSFTASMLMIAALVAVFLGSVGIYGALSYIVSQRTTEIGIRTALGATPGRVRRMVLSQGMRLAGVGVLVGLVAAVALGGCWRRNSTASAPSIPSRSQPPRRSSWPSRCSRASCRPPARPAPRRRTRCAETAAPLRHAARGGKLGHLVIPAAAKRN